MIFRLLRFYSITSLAAILAIAIVLTLYYRHTAMQQVVQLVEENNVALAQAALMSLKPELDDFIRLNAAPGSWNAAVRSTAFHFGTRMSEVMRNASLLRVELYNAEGRIIWSSETSQIGITEPADAGFAAALEGRVVSRLLPRGSSELATMTSGSVVETYIPVRLPGSARRLPSKSIRT